MKIDKQIKSLFFFLLLLLLLLSLYHPSYAQSVTININSTVFFPGSMLVLYGKALPNDSLIVELINPMNRIVHRAQIDVDGRGIFSSIIITFPEPNTQFIEGTYTLVVTSSMQGSVYSKALVFQKEERGIAVQPDVTLQQQQASRRLDIQLSVPSIVGINERASIVARVTLDGILFNVNASDIKARIVMPDSSTIDLGFTAVDDGIYATDLTFNMKGLHVVTASIEHDNLRATGMASIEVIDTPVLNMSNTLSKLNDSIDGLKASIDALRSDINASNAMLTRSLEQIDSSTNQMLAMLLPIIGMITVIVALQATILARRSKVE